MRPLQIARSLGALFDLQTCVALTGLVLLTGGVAVKLDGAWAAIIVGVLLLAVTVWPYIKTARAAAGRGDGDGSGPARR